MQSETEIKPRVVRNQGAQWWKIPKASLGEWCSFVVLILILAIQTQIFFMTLGVQHPGAHRGLVVTHMLSFLLLFQLKALRGLGISLCFLLWLGISLVSH